MPHINSEISKYPTDLEKICMHHLSTLFSYNIVPAKQHFFLLNVIMFQGKMFQGKLLSGLVLLQIALSLNFWLVWTDCSPFRRNAPWENKPGSKKIALHVVIANLLQVFNNMVSGHQIQKQAHNHMRWPKCYHDLKKKTTGPVLFKNMHLMNASYFLFFNKNILN